MGVEHFGKRLAVVEEHVLPLAHVAQIVVVKQHHLDWGLLLHDGAKLLNAHLEATVACEQAHRAVGSAKGCTHGSGKTEAHGSQSAARHDASLEVKLRVATREHLVLAHIGHDDSLALCHLCHHVGHLTHEQRALGGMYGRLYDLLVLLVKERFEAVTPLAVHVLLQQTGDGRQRHLAVAHHSNIGLHVLVDLGLIDVEMYNFCLLGISVETSCHTVAEAHAYGNEHITLVLHDVRRIVAMHSEHAHIKRMVAWKGRQTEQGACCGNVGTLQELNQLVLRSTKFHTLTHKSQRTLSSVNQFGSLLHGSL